MKTIMTHIFASDLGGCGIIRSWIPSILVSQHRTKEATYIQTYNYQFIPDINWYKNYKWVKFQRPAEPQHLQMIKFIKEKTQTKVLLDFDDDVFCIPETNMAKYYYEQRKDIIKKCIELADGITVSTKTLKNVISEYNNNIQVVPNYIAEFLWGKPEWKEKNHKKPRILYPGSATHFNQKGSGGDFDKNLINFIQKTVDIYDWWFIGGIPFELKNNNKINYIPWVQYFQFPQYLKNLNANIAITPLKYNEFNRSKSNIKVLEYIASGICGLFQDIEPYFNTTQKFKNSDELISNIEELAFDQKKQKEIWEKDLQKNINIYMEQNIDNWINKNLKLIGKGI